VAQYKFGPPNQKEWEIQLGDSYILGSQSQDFSQSRYRPDVEIYIPDSGIAPRHAILFAREGRFFMTRHPDAADQAAIARFRLRVRGKTVIKTQELHGGDDILLGKTALKFVARREGA
jgi:pSer/pThr/pTyr-binding forkhead associated (FHA) protein